MSEDIRLADDDLGPFFGFWLNNISTQLAFFIAFVSLNWSRSFALDRAQMVWIWVVNNAAWFLQETTPAGGEMGYKEEEWDIEDPCKQNLKIRQVVDVR